MKTRVAAMGRLSISMLTAAALLSGCAQGQFSTQSARIGRDDGSDSCRPQLVALDSTGDFFGTSILAGVGAGALAGGLAGGLIGGDWRGALIGAAVGGALGGAGGYWAALQQQSQDQASLYAHVQGDLSHENAQIDRTQLAFDQLTDCRFRQAQAINAALRNGGMDHATAEARMAQVKQWARRDITVAQSINQQITGRAQQFDVATDNVAPGTTGAIAARGFAPQATAAQVSAPLKLRPDPDAPDIGRLAARQPVTVTGTRNGYALVRTDTGEQGFAPIASLRNVTARPGPRQGNGGAAESGDVRTLAGSNAARRDDFAQSVAVAEHATAAGFEVAG